jgi:hypothetical protein
VLLQNERKNVYTRHMYEECACTYHEMEDE